MDYVAILSFISKTIKYAKVALELGKDATPFLDAGQEAASGNITPERMATLDEDCERIHAEVQALPDDPPNPAETEEVIAEQGGDGGKPADPRPS